MRAFVSVDWDFFVRSLYAWDWGHQESPFFMEGPMWEIRVSGLLMNGLDIRGEMDPEKWADPKPLEFWSTLRQLGYNFDVIEETCDTAYLSSPNFVIADSHAIAGPAFNGVAEEIGAPEIILNFDAHHDMGYRSRVEVNKMVTRGEVTCDMWLRSLMSQDSFLDAKTRAHVIYPNWRFAEFPMSEEWNALREVLPRGILGRTAIGPFAKPDGSATDVVCPAEEIEVVALFICRSSAWTPPWLDGRFVEFVRSLGKTPYEFEYVSEHTPDIRPFTPRTSFSWERAETMAAQFKGMMAHRQRS
jgi:hypothetical protein